MKKSSLFALLVLIILSVSTLTACGPDASPEQAVAADEAQASALVCRRAFYCFKGATPSYYYLGDYATQQTACNAAVAAGTCTGNASGVCYYATRAPTGCTPR